MKLSQTGIIIYVVAFINFTAIHLGINMSANYFMGSMFGGVFLFLIALFFEDDDEVRKSSERSEVKNEE